MWANWLILAVGSALTMLGLWMSFPYLAAVRGWSERATGTVVGAEYRARLSEENVERWWRIEVQAMAPTGVVIVRVPITTAAAERIARGDLTPFGWSAPMAFTFTLADEVVRERDHFNAQADRLVGQEVGLAVPSRDAPLRPKAIIVDPPACARQALVPLLVLGLGALVTVPSVVVAVVLT